MGMGTSFTELALSGRIRMGVGGGLGSLVLEATNNKGIQVDLGMRLVRRMGLDLTESL